MRFKIIRINMPWNFPVSNLLIPLLRTKVNQRIIPMSNFLYATFYDIFGPLREVPFKSKETVKKNHREDHKVENHTPKSYTLNDIVTFHLSIFLPLYCLFFSTVHFSTSIGRFVPLTMYKRDTALLMSSQVNFDK